ncbi:MAG: glycosyltransferase, partial [Candidatus Promineifilaceae bacterium]
MRICLALLYYDRSRPAATPAAYLEQRHFLPALARALAERGHQVDAVVLFEGDAELQRDGVGYHFVAASPIERAVAAAAGRLGRTRGSDDRFVRRAAGQVRSLRPDVVHFVGLNLYWALHILLRTL